MYSTEELMCMGMYKIKLQGLKWRDANKKRKKIHLKINKNR